MKRIVFKNCCSQILRESVILESALLETLWKDAEPTDRLVYKGQILDKHSLLTLSDIFSPNSSTAVVFVVGPLPPSIPKNEVSTSSQHSEQQQHQPDKKINEDKSDRRCRICFSEEDQTSDALFSPCHCKGSMALVHPSCLSAWREQPSNPLAHRECINCHYSYRLQKSWFQTWFRDADQFALWCGAVYLLAIVLAVFFMSLLWGRTWISQQFFIWIEYEPWSIWQYHFLVSLCVVGGVGFVIHIKHVVEMARLHGSMEQLFFVGLLLTANGSRGIRMFCFTGMTVSMGLLYQHSQLWSRRFFVRLGERVLPAVEET